MVQESLIEKIVLAKQALEYKKDPNIWGSPGCLGHPALTLLMSIADTIGSCVIGGRVRNHFNILNNPNYYNLKLSKENIDIIYEKYRNYQTHNSTLAVDCFLDIGGPRNLPYERIDNTPIIFLVPLYNATVSALNCFLQNADTLIPASKQYQEIIRK